MRRNESLLSLESDIPGNAKSSFYKVSSDWRNVLNIWILNGLIKITAKQSNGSLLTMKIKSKKKPQMID